MGFWEFTERFDGKRVVDYTPGMDLDPENLNYRIRREYDSEHDFSQLLSHFAAADNVDQVTGLLTGAYDDEMFDPSNGMGSVVEGVVAIAPRLPSLTGLFIGDIIAEESEISWIQQSDVSPIWQAFPRLRTLQLRGGAGLSLGEVAHDQLKTLIIQAGGLPREVVREVAAARLPELEHLELYLGEPNYGGDSSIEDLQPLLSGDLFPKLKYLGLKNSEFQDGIAKASAQAPIVERLEVLDLSLGNMTDEGANALLAGTDHLGKLKKLNLEHHFVTSEVAAQFSSWPCEVNLQDSQEPHTYGDEVYRFIAISE